MYNYRSEAFSMNTHDKCVEQKTFDWHTIICIFPKEILFYTRKMEKHFGLLNNTLFSISEQHLVVKVPFTIAQSARMSA